MSQYGHARWCVARGLSQTKRAITAAASKRGRRAAAHRTGGGNRLVGAIVAKRSNCTRLYL